MLGCSESVRDYSEARAAGASESAVAPEPPQTPVRALLPECACKMSELCTDPLCRTGSCWLHHQVWGLLACHPEGVQQQLAWPELVVSRAGAREGSMQQGGKPPPFAAVPASQAQPPDPAGVKPEQEWTALEVCACPTLCRRRCECSVCLIVSCALQLDLAASQAGCRAPLLCRASFWWQFFVVGVTLGLTLYGLYLRDLRSTAVSMLRSQCTECCCFTTQLAH